MKAGLAVALASLMVSPLGLAKEWPRQTLMLVSDPTMLVLGDPGPGDVPQGEPDGSTLRQSFYYHGTATNPAISMVLVETDCSTTGKWRIRANTDILVNDKGMVTLSRQSLASRTSSWTVEPEEDSLGLAVWRNTCHGDTSGVSVGDFTPWEGTVLWQEQRIHVEDTTQTPPSTP